MNVLQKPTGYPSIDKPWLKNYGEEEIEVSENESMYQMLWRVNQERLDCDAIHYFGRKITFHELFNNIRKTVTILKKWGVCQHERVLCFALNTPESLYCIYALNYIGAIADLEYVNLDSKALAEVLKRKQPKHIIAVDIFEKTIDDAVKVSKLETKLLTFGVSDSMPFVKKMVVRFAQRKKNRNGAYIERVKYKGVESNGEEAMPCLKEDTAVIIRTGGTTGVPKGVRLSNYNVNILAEQYRHHQLLNLIPGERYQNIAPPFYAFGLSLAIHAPLCVGLTLCLTPDPNPANAAKTYAMYCPNHYMGGPGHIHAIINDKTINKRNLSDVKTLSVGGESMSLVEVEQANQFLEKHDSKARLITGYGMSEFGGTISTEANSRCSEGSVGFLFPLANVRILDEVTHEEKKYQEEGEILLTAPNMMLGYDDDPEEEKAIITIDSNNQKWIKTGDIGYVDENGFLYIRGRLKRIYLTKGHDNSIYKLFPNRIEEVISEVEGVSDVAVIAVEYEKSFYKAYAFIKSNYQDKEKIIGHCMERLAPYMIPADMFWVEGIPRNSNGKVDYVALEKKYSDMKE